MGYGVTVGVNGGVFTIKVAETVFGCIPLWFCPLLSQQSASMLS